MPAPDSLGIVQVYYQIEPAGIALLEGLLRVSLPGYYTKSVILLCMAKHPPITLVAHLAPEDLQERYRTCAKAREARRWHALWLLSLGHPIGDVAALLGLHRNGVRNLLKRYNADGPTAVPDQPPQQPKGPRPTLSEADQHDLAVALTARPADGGIWTGPKVAAWIAQRTGRAHVHPQLGWVYLRKLGQTPKTPRPRHAHAASAEEQTAWKKN